MNIIYTELCKHVPLTTSQYYFVGTTKKSYTSHIVTKYIIQIQVGDSSPMYPKPSFPQYQLHTTLKNVTENNLYPERRDA